MIRVDSFNGEAPSIASSKLENGQAQQAIDCVLLNGNLRPARTNAPTALSIQSDVKTLALLTSLRDSDGNMQSAVDGGVWLKWQKKVDVAKAPIPNDDLHYMFYTGDGFPKMSWHGESHHGSPAYPPGDNYRRIGVPAPDSAMTATVSGETTFPGATPTARPYVVTYVCKSGSTIYTQEGAQSPSVMIDWLPGQTVTLSDIPVPQGDSGVTHKRIYRYQKGSGGGVFNFLAEVKVNDTTFVDTVTDDNLPGGVLETADFTPPPDDLQGIVTLAGGVMAGFSGRDIWFSEPHHPFAWPLGYRMTVDYDPVALAPLGNGVVVVTTGYPYVISGTSPAVYGKQRLNIDQSCVSKESVVSDGGTVIYAAPDGLVGVTLGGAKVLTEKLLNTPQWRALKPEKMRCEVHDSFVIVFYDNDEKQGSIVIDPKNSRAGLTFSGEYTHISYRDLVDDTLYIESNGALQKWREGDSLVSYRWRSKRFVFGKPVSMSAIKIETLQDENDPIFERNGGNPITEEKRTVSVKVFADGNILKMPDGSDFELTYRGAGDMDLSHSRSGAVNRLPAYGAAHTWEFELNGDAEVRSVAIAPSVAGLR